MPVLFIFYEANAEVKNNSSIEHPPPALPVDMAGDTRADSPVLFGPVSPGVCSFNFIFKLFIIYFCKAGGG